MNHDGVDYFSGLPPQIIQNIVVAACAINPSGPPNTLVRLLQVSRALYGALCPQHNPGVHARIFSIQFDSEAPTRRYTDAGRPLSAPNFAHELRRRWTSLKRIRVAATAKKLTVCSEDDFIEDLWMVYIMAMESDGCNMDQLYWARAVVYVRSVIRDHLMPSARPGYVIESTSRALGLWLMWFFTEAQTVVAETLQEATHMCALLRPWALASHKYDILHTPYTHWALPVPEVSVLGKDLTIGARQVPANLDLRSHTQIVMHMGRRIRLAPPRASVAAIMGLMARIECAGPISTHPAASIPDIPGMGVYPRTRFPSLHGRGSFDFDARVNCVGSASQDAEWRRILQCGSPFAKPKFKTQPLIRPGQLAGSWEGRTVFLTSNEFRDLLGGVTGMATHAPLSQQPRSWHIREHHIVSRRRRNPIGRESPSVTGEQLPVGQALNAFIPQGSQFIHHNKSTVPGTHRLEVRVPDATTPLGYKSYTYVTLDDPKGPPPARMPTETILTPSHPPLRVDDIPVPLDWDVPRPPTLGDGDDQFDEEILDTLITGEGHSSVGSFKLRGRIRAWDGMIIFVQEFDPLATEPNRRWLYMGYLVSGVNWVGRWRDTSTEEKLVGYEEIKPIGRPVGFRNKLAIALLLNHHII